MENGPDGAVALHVASQHEPSPQGAPSGGTGTLGLVASAAALHVAAQHEPSPQEAPLRMEKARWGLWLRPLRFTLLRNMSLRRKKCPFGSLLVAQLAAQDFAYGGLGQLGAELDHLGLLVAVSLYTSPSPRDLSTSRMPSSA